MQNTYIIVPEIDVTDMMIIESLNKPTTYRRSIDGTFALLKYYSLHPDCCGGLQKYTYTEILVEMEKTAWNPESP